LQMLESAGFVVNRDNRVFESFEPALEYAKRLVFHITILAQLVVDPYSL
jgi:hypothetical protein